MKRVVILLISTAIVLTAACRSTRHSYGWTSHPTENPGTAWAGLAPVPAPAVQTHPAQLPPAGTVLGLEQVVDITLQNNPRTRAAWAQARAAWAEAGSKASGLYPKADLDASLWRGKLTGSGGSSSTLLTTYGPSVTLSALLFDFGKTRAEVESSRAAALAAAYAHNAVLSDVALQAEEAFYSYVQSKALREAARDTVDDAAENLKAAEERHKAGVATIADVLQARTAHSQAFLNLQKAEGAVMTLRGALATQMGLAANAPYEVEMPEAASVVPQAAQETIDALVAVALEGRPDLEAARAEVAAALEQADAARRQRWPRITLSAGAGRTYFDTATGDRTVDPWSGSVGLTVPLFTGFERKYEILKAEALAESAAALAEALADEVILSVWSAYYDLQTAVQAAATSVDLLASAKESEEVTFERYKAGVGTLLDLLASQSALANARAQRVQSLADWYVAVARLAHSTGRLRAPEPPAPQPFSTETQP